MEPETLKVVISERESVSALLYPAAKPRAGVTIVLGHGAGANQLSGFMREFAHGLASRGFDVMTFNFLYTEQKRRLPDSNGRLEGCYRAVIASALAHAKLKKNRLVIGGKSMGGRIASQVAGADGENIDGLVLLGYPLHPPGKPEKLRDAHLKEVSAPMLFVQGSRDAFGTEDEIRAVIKKLKLTAKLYMVAGGDHSFKVPKSAGVTQQEVHEKVMDEIAAWVQSCQNRER